MGTCASSGLACACSCGIRDRKRLACFCKFCYYLRLGVSLVFHNEAQLHELHLNTPFRCMLHNIRIRLLVRGTRLDKRFSHELSPALRFWHRQVALHVARCARSAH